MVIDIPNDRLIAFCGGDWGNATSTDIGAIVMEYLEGNQMRRSERRASMGDFLVDVLEAHLSRSL